MTPYRVGQQVRHVVASELAAHDRHHVTGISTTVGEVVGGCVLLTAGVQVVGPPLAHKPALLDVLGLVDVGRTYPVALLVAHLPFYRVTAPQPRLHQGGTGHRSEPVPAHVRLGVVPHAAQGGVYRVLAHWLPVVVIPGKDQFVVPGELVHLGQQRQRLPTQWDKVRGGHLGATGGMLYALDGLALSGDRPKCALEVDFIPAGKTQSLERVNTNRESCTAMRVSWRPL